MADETYYTVLGVAPTASAEEIKVAYRELIRQVHPDALPNASDFWKGQAEQHARDINEAYQVLSDSDRRRQYDQQLDAYMQSHTRQGPVAPNDATQPRPASAGIPPNVPIKTPSPARDWKGWRYLLFIALFSLSGFAILRLVRSFTSDRTATATEQTEVHSYRYRLSTPPADPDRFVGDLGTPTAVSGRHYDVETNARGRILRVVTIRNGKSIYEERYLYSTDDLFIGSEFFTYGAKTGATRYTRDSTGELRRTTLVQISISHLKV